MPTNSYRQEEKRSDLPPPVLFHVKHACPVGGVGHLRSHCATGGGFWPYIGRAITYRPASWWIPPSITRGFALRIASGVIRRDVDIPRDGATTY